MGPKKEHQPQHHQRAKRGSALLKHNPQTVLVVLLCGVDKDSGFNVVLRGGGGGTCCATAFRILSVAKASYRGVSTRSNEERCQTFPYIVYVTALHLSRLPELGV